MGGGATAPRYEATGEGVRPTSAGPALTLGHGAPQTVPFTAVAAAGSCNAALMRYKDLTCAAAPDCARRPCAGLCRAEAASDAGPCARGQGGHRSVLP